MLEKRYIIQEIAMDLWELGYFISQIIVVNFQIPLTQLPWVIKQVWAPKFRGINLQKCLFEI